MASSSCECWPDRPPQFSPASHRRAAASLLDWLAIPDGSPAKTIDRKGGSLWTASSSCECSPDMPPQLSPASHRGAAASLLDWSEIPDGSGAKQTERKGGSLWSASSLCECRPDRHTKFAPASHRRAAASLLDWSAGRRFHGSKHSRNLTARSLTATARSPCLQDVHPKDLTQYKGATPCR